MDFLERWFALSPDGGDGSLEIVYLAVMALAVGAFLSRWYIRWLISSKRAEAR
jgi:hypothetical protein